MNGCHGCTSRRGGEASHWYWWSGKEITGQTSVSIRRGNGSPTRFSPFCREFARRSNWIRRAIKRWRMTAHLSARSNRFAAPWSTRAVSYRPARPRALRSHAVTSLHGRWRHRNGDVNYTGGAVTRTVTLRPMTSLYNRRRHCMGDDVFIRAMTSSYGQWHQMAYGVIIRRWSYYTGGDVIIRAMTSLWPPIYIWRSVNETQ